MKELTLFQKTGCGLALLLVALLLVAVTATALNSATATISAASVQIHESADQATVDLSQQVTLREMTAGLVRANDNMARITEKVIDAGQQREASGLWWWQFCGVVIVIGLAACGVLLMRRGYV